VICSPRSMASAYSVSVTTPGEVPAKHNNRIILLHPYTTHDPIASRGQRWPNHCLANGRVPSRCKRMGCPSSCKIPGTTRIDHDTLHAAPLALYAAKMAPAETTMVWCTNRRAQRLCRAPRVR
jgi:hypothetical protein